MSAKGNGGQRKAPTRYFVQPTSDGQYEVKAAGADRASAKRPTQREAGTRAAEIVKNRGGGEVTYRNAQGRITDSDTIAPGNDPNPPKDTKH